MPVRHFHHFALGVPDVQAQKTFYEDFGLVGGADGNGAIMRCVGRDQDQVVLVESKERTLHHLSFGATEESVADIKKRVERHADATLVDGPNETPYPGIWFTDRDGMLYNVHVGEPAPSNGGQRPLTPQPAFRMNSPGHYDRLNRKGSVDADTQRCPRFWRSGSLGAGQLRR